MTDKTMRVPGAKAMMRALEKKRDQVAKLRDQLRDLEQEYATLADGCNEAHYQLSVAIDALSEYA